MEAGKKSSKPKWLWIGGHHVTNPTGPVREHVKGWYKDRHEGTKDPIEAIKMRMAGSNSSYSYMQPLKFIKIYADGSWEDV